MPFPQKDALPPAFRKAVFSVLVNDVPRTPGVELSLLADDAATNTPAVPAVFAAARLQRQLDVYVDWADDLKVAVNASKSTAVLLTRRRKQPRLLTICPAELPWAGQVKYFGLHLDSKLTWRYHAEAVRRKA